MDSAILHGHIHLDIGRVQIVIGGLAGSFDESAAGPQLR